MNRIPNWAVLTLVLLAALLLPPQPRADEEDSGKVMLRLLVTTCNSTPLDSAAVVVNLYRPGTGIFGYESGYTDEGAIVFALAGLECEDEARVTVTPDGGASDPDHCYIYVGDCEGDNPTLWDIDTSANLCKDDWLEILGEDVINTVYEEDEE